MKTKKSNVFLAVLSAMLLAVGLSACAGADYEKDFVGTWVLESVEGEDPASAESVGLLKEMEVEVTLGLEGEGLAVLSIMDSTEEGTWKAESATEATLQFDEATQTAVLDAGELRLSAEDTTMVFVQAE